VFIVYVNAVSHKGTSFQRNPTRPTNGANNRFKRSAHLAQKWQQTDPIPQGTNRGCGFPVSEDRY
jgi:hypothetical protein